MAAAARVAARIFFGLFIMLLWPEHCMKTQPAPSSQGPAVAQKMSKAPAAAPASRPRPGQRRAAAGGFEQAAGRPGRGQEEERQELHQVAALDVQAEENQQVVGEEGGPEEAPGLFAGGRGSEGEAESGQSEQQEVGGPGEAAQEAGEGRRHPVVALAFRSEGAAAAAGR